MSTALLVKRLRDLRVDLSVSATGKLHVEAPAGTLTDELRATLAAHRDALLAVARDTAAMSQPPRVSDFPPASLDPRPDLTDDAMHWRRLLELAWHRDGNDREGLYGVLRGIRCLGVRLTPGKGTLRLQARVEPPGEPPLWATREQYGAERARWLEPHRETLVVLLAHAFDKCGG
jgi:hypothetical protein